jgi:hypothetical protein
MTTTTEASAEQLATLAPPPAAGTFRIGSGAGFAGDRYEPAELLAAYGQLDALAFECLAERTIGLAQRARLAGESEGFDRRILRRLGGTLPHLKPDAIVTTNAGAANPVAAAQAALERIAELGLPARKVAAITGDDILEKIDLKAAQVWDSDQTLWDIRDQLVSANAYFGVEPIVSALDQGATLVLTGRCSDAALFAAPLAYHFGWKQQNLQEMANANLVGHLLECAGQLTGGYFADGGRKSVQSLWNIGFPFADVAKDGSAVYSKLPGTGGRIDRTTVLEQLLYEIDDVAKYVTPDVILDLRSVIIREIDSEHVAVEGVIPGGAPEMLKASVGVRNGYLATSEISYAGRGCKARALMAAEAIIERWIRIHRLETAALEYSIIGLNSTRPWQNPTGPEPTEVRVRFTLRTRDRRLADLLCEEVEALYTNGPAGGGGVVGLVRETVAIVSTLVPRSAVEAKIVFVG